MLSLFSVLTLRFAPAPAVLLNPRGAFACGLPPFHRLRAVVRPPLDHNWRCGCRLTSHQGHTRPVPPCLWLLLPSFTLPVVRFGGPWLFPCRQVSPPYFPLSHCRGPCSRSPSPTLNVSALGVAEGRAFSLPLVAVSSFLLLCLPRAYFLSFSTPTGGTAHARGRYHVFLCRPPVSFFALDLFSLPCPSFQAPRCFPPVALGCACFGFAAASCVVAAFFCFCSLLMALPCPALRTHLPASSGPSYPLAGCTR